MLYYIGEQESDKDQISSNWFTEKFAQTSG